MKHKDLVVGQEYGTRMANEWSAPKRVRVLDLRRHRSPRFSSDWHVVPGPNRSGHVLVESVPDGWRDCIPAGQIFGTWAEAEAEHKRNIEARNSRLRDEEEKRKRLESEWLALGVRDSYGHEAVSIHIDDMRRLRERWMAEGRK